MIGRWGFHYHDVVACGGDRVTFDIDYAVEGPTLRILRVAGGIADEWRFSPAEYDTFVDAAARFRDAYQAQKP